MRDMETHCNLLDGRACRGGFPISWVHSRGVALFEGRIHAYTTVLHSENGVNENHVEQMIAGFTH